MSKKSLFLVICTTFLLINNLVDWRIILCKLFQLISSRIYVYRIKVTDKRFWYLCSIKLIANEGCQCFCKCSKSWPKNNIYTTLNTRTSLCKSCQSDLSLSGPFKLNFFSSDPTDFNSSFHIMCSFCCKT